MEELFAEERRLTIELGYWPAPFISYGISDYQGRRIGYVGKNTEIEDEFSIQLYDADELNSSWANVKRPQPIWTGRYKTVARCLLAASIYLHPLAT
jgi:hypothetical protein